MQKRATHNHTPTTETRGEQATAKSRGTGGWGAERGLRRAESEGRPTFRLLLTPSLLAPVTTPAVRSLPRLHHGLVHRLPQSRRACPGTAEAPTAESNESCSKTDPRRFSLVPPPSLLPRPRSAAAHTAWFESGCVCGGAVGRDGARTAPMGGPNKKPDPLCENERHPCSLARPRDPRPVSRRPRVCTLWRLQKGGHMLRVWECAGGLAELGERENRRPAKTRGRPTPPTPPRPALFAPCPTSHPRAMEPARLFPVLAKKLNTPLPSLPHTNSRAASRPPPPRAPSGCPAAPRPPT